MNLNLLTCDIFLHKKIRVCIKLLPHSSWKIQKEDDKDLSYHDNLKIFIKSALLFAKSIMPFRKFMAFFLKLF